MKKTILPIMSIIIAALFSCNSSDSKARPAKDTATKQTSKQKKDTIAKPVVLDTRRPGIINIVDTVSSKMIVIYIKDSAATFERISMKLGQIYGPKLAAAFKQAKVKMAGPPMAWYKTQKAPYFFEAGIPVNKKPVKLPKAVFVKEMRADSVTLAHFYGPYDLTKQAYEAIKERLKDTKKRANGAPYEQYVSDPMDKNGKMADPYKVRTDVVFPRN